MTEKQFSDWYRNKIHQTNEEPPQEVWGNISNRIDVNETWKNINKHFDYRQLRKNIIRTVSMSSFFLTLLVISMLYIYNFPAANTNFSVSIPSESKSIEKKNNDKQKITAANSIENNNSEPSPHETSALALQNNSKSSDNINISSKSIVRTNSNIIAANPEGMNTHKKQEQYISKENPVEEDVAIMKPYIILPLDLKITLLTTMCIYSFSIINTIASAQLVNVDAADNPVCTTGGKPKGQFYTGLSYSYNNIWLLNNQTFSGLSSSSLNQTQPSFASAYGITAGYNHSNSFGIVLDWNIKSNSGQTYKYYNNGEYVTATTNLEYTSLAISLKRRTTIIIPHFFKGEGSRNFIFGIQSKLLLAENSSATQNLPCVQSSQYRKFDYGLRLGYEYEIILRKKLILSAAIISDVGTRNIYKGSVYEPADFNRTRNASAGLNIGIRYLVGNSTSIDIE